VSKKVVMFARASEFFGQSEIEKLEKSLTKGIERIVILKTEIYTRTREEED